MAVNESFKEYVVDQLAELGFVTVKKMLAVLVFTMKV